MPSAICLDCDKAAQAHCKGRCWTCHSKRDILEGKYWECSKCCQKVSNDLLRYNECRQRKPQIIYGTAVGFGSGDFDLLGPLGDENEDVLTPRLLVNLLELNITQVACGPESSLALTEKGEVYTWGEYSQWGAGDDDVVRIEGFKPSNNEPEAVIKNIQQGSTHFLALSSAGDIYVGRKYTHQSSGRTFQHISSLNNDNDKESRTGKKWQVHCLAGIKAKSISSGKEFCATLLENNTIVTWGVRAEGLARPVPLLNEASDEDMEECYLHPNPPLWDSIANGEWKVLSMACGLTHLLVVTEGHVVYSSGINANGQLGHGDCNDREILTKINALLGKDIVIVAAGNAFSFFVNQRSR